MNVITNEQVLTSVGDYERFNFEPNTTLYVLIREFSNPVSDIPDLEVFNGVAFEPLTDVKSVLASFKLVQVRMSTVLKNAKNKGLISPNSIYKITYNGLKEPKKKGYKPYHDYSISKLTVLSDLANRLAEFSPAAPENPSLIVSEEEVEVTTPSGVKRL